MSGPTDYDFQSCEVSIAGARYPIGGPDMAREVAELPAMSFPLRNHRRFDVAVDLKMAEEADSFGFDLLGLLKAEPPKLEMVLTAPWYGGELSLLVAECTPFCAKDWGSGEFEMTTFGDARRAEFVKDGRRVAWDPGAVTVRPCLAVGQS